MKTFLIIAASVIGFCLFSCLFVYLIIFARSHKDPGVPEDGPYAPFLDEIHRDIDLCSKMDCEEIWIRSFDGTKLRARYYETCPGAQLDILCHGYRGEGIRDFCTGMPFYLSLGHNVLLIDERGHGRSGGRCTTFGILESRDIVLWAKYAANRFTDVPIFLCGISMGASAVLMASADPELPPSVRGILADCGFTSAWEIIRKVTLGMGHPWPIVGPSALGGAFLYGWFGLRSRSALESVWNARVPIQFIHGEADDFVPCEMTLRNYAVCTAPKRLLTVPGAGHGLSFLKDRDAYAAAVRSFFKDVLSGEIFSESSIK